MSELLSSANFKSQALVNKLRLAKEKPSRRMQLYWLQKQHIAGDNSFNPYILYAEGLKDVVHESHRAEAKSQNDRDNKSPNEKLRLLPPKKLLGIFGRHLTTFAVVIGVLGFVAQFQGLRFSNWTCSIAQLIALGLATTLRAWVRRSMTKRPVDILVHNDYMLDHLTLAIIGAKSSDSEFPTPEGVQSPRLSLRFGVITNPKLRAITEPESEKEPNLAQQALNLRIRLGRITKWIGPKSQEAICLSNSIETALERLSLKLPSKLRKKCAVVLEVDTYRTMPHVPPSFTTGSREEVELYLVGGGNKWKVDDAQLEALLSLVSYSVWAVETSMRNQEETTRGDSLAPFESSRHRTKRKLVENNRSMGWLRMKAPDSRVYDQIVGKSSQKLRWDLRWWIPNTKQVIKKPRTIYTCGATRFLADFTYFLSDREVERDEVERPTLGFYVNDETSGETGRVEIQRHLWRANLYR